MVSHEFRTPLAAIQTSSDLLSRYMPRMSEQQRQEHLYRISDQVTNLVNLLDEVMTLSRADSIGLTFEPLPTNVSDLCQEVAHSVERAMRADGEILINTPPTSLIAELDAKLFREALANLLSNAIKYSPPGVPVNLNVREARGELIVQVKDHGIGIPEEDRARLFEAFHRARNVGAIAGTGLGLAIVKRAIDAHGGSVSVQSEVGVGTEFALRLPLTQAKGRAS
jgi:signal transduction histidine kinase